MSRVALLYNFQDLQPLVANATRTNLPQADRQLCQKIWNGGLRNWDDLQIARFVAPAYQQGDPDTRGVIIDTPDVTKQDIIDLFNRIGTTTPGAGFLQSIADDMRTSALEPPPADLFG
jgi:hypothetical protein